MAQDLEKMGHPTGSSCKHVVCLVFKLKSQVKVYDQEHRIIGLVLGRYLPREGDLKCQSMQVQKKKKILCTIIVEN